MKPRKRKRAALPFKNCMGKRSGKKKNTALKVTVSVLAAFLAAMLIAFTFLYIFKSNPKVSSQSDAQAESETSSSLSDLFIRSDTCENLLVYSGDALLGMSYPDIYLCDSGIIFCDLSYSESEDSYACLYLFDASSGSIISENSLYCEFLTDLRQTENGIMLSDSSLGSVFQLDSSLTLINEYSFDPNYEYWYISEDGKSLFMIDETSLDLIDLESGSSAELLKSSVSLYGSEALNGGANITYVDEEEMTREVWLDLETGGVCSFPYDVTPERVSESEGIWLAEGINYSSGEYFFGTESEAFYVSLEEGSLSMIEGCDMLLYTDGGGNSYAVYDSTGAYISSCEILEEDAWFNTRFILYSEDYGGFFILACSDEGPVLYFWELGEDEEGEDLAASPIEEYGAAKEGSAADASLYERAAEIGDTYAVEILIADQCETEYEDFTAKQVSDYDLIENGLDILEEALSSYPEGFLKQLKYDKTCGIRICLCGALTSINSSWGQEDYNAFTGEYADLNIIVFDLEQLYTETVYHEISHIIDKKLEWDAYCREDALYSEDGWEALDPDGFEYTYVYNGFEELGFEGDEYLYFIDTYSMVSPTEDRARIMEYAMAGYDWYFTEYEPLRAKLSYYCECIRDAFDTQGWPETAAWEEAL